MLRDCFGDLTLFFAATYSNLENHPRLIRASRGDRVPKIRLDPKTGLPFVDVVFSYMLERTISFDLVLITVEVLSFTLMMQVSSPHRFL